MKLSLAESKKIRIKSWIRNIRSSDAKVLVDEYCYNCFFNGNLLTKTLIVFPDDVETKGIITIDKPLSQVGIIDIIKLYTRIKN